MKNKISLIFTLVFMIANTAYSQQLTPAAPDYDHKLELTPLVGYLLNGNIDFIQGELSFDNKINYGLALGVATGYGTFVEAIYTFSATTARFRSYDPQYENQVVSTNINYIQIGGIKEFMDGQVRPFGTIGLGASGFVPQESGFDSWWSFAINFGLGVKINLNEKIGIRLQGRMLLPLYYGGAGFYCGTGGCGGGASAYSSMVQGDFMGGIVIGIN